MQTSRSNSKVERVMVYDAAPALIPVASKKLPKANLSVEQKSNPRI